MKTIITLVLSLLLAAPLAAQNLGAGSVIYTVVTAPTTCSDGDLIKFSAAVTGFTPGIVYVCKSNAFTSAGVKTVEASIDFGANDGEVFTLVVTGQAWVTTTSRITCAPFATASDGQTIETYIAAGLGVAVSSLVAGTGFTLWVDSSRGATGIFRFHCTGS